MSSDPSTWNATWRYVFGLGPKPQAPKSTPRAKFTPSSQSRVQDCPPTAARASRRANTDPIF